MHEHGHSHGADPARDGRDLRGLRGDRIEVDIADESIAAFARPILHAVDAHINHCDAFFHHFARDEIGAPDCGDEHIRLARDFSEVLSAGVANGDGGISGDRFAHHE